jgi:hypothetical protein
MGLESLLKRLEGRSVTPVTPPVRAGVTANGIIKQACNPRNTCNTKKRRWSAQGDHQDRGDTHLRDGARHERVIIDIGKGTKEHRSFVSNPAPGGLSLADWEARVQAAHGDTATVRPVPPREP